MIQFWLKFKLYLQCAFIIFLWWGVIWIGRNPELCGKWWGDFQKSYIETFNDRSLPGNDTDTLFIGTVVYDSIYFGK